MKKFGLVFTAVLAMSPLAAWAGDQDFTLVNKTGYQIDEVYVATPSSKSWGKDIMGDGVLANGAKKNVKFKNSTTACNWQLAVKFSDGSDVEWDEPFDLCEVEVITLKYNKSTGITSAETK
ncbi:hypothetical protein [Magnetospirillum moscoviense]|uniref:Argininosuccinate lyase n=1 Tax=Magnetospirillum moscoviense TaxID=1437059 RepID=A0A178MHY3_9PROT|nr:hypothetical protein [Magnetospirillum moscoviense]OAN47738.1 hypothetical protein A6A05_15470 [Magnetospirillum moscoviense]